MAATAPSFTLGIEEEYLLVDRQTRDIVPDPPDDMLTACEAVAPGQVHPEFLRCQIEIGTRVCADLSEAKGELTRLRLSVADVVSRYGLAPIAASPIPSRSGCRRSIPTATATTCWRAISALRHGRLMICGMHVHVGIEDENLRIDLMNQVRYFLPHLLALSTSSPFWQGQDSGLKSYRLAVWNELPRTGMPEEFHSFGEFQQQVGALIEAGVIEDATKLWWDIRPSSRFPTLEMRISDICTQLDDTLTVAALYVCLLRMLWRLRRDNVQWRRYRNLLIEENRWRAQRYGFDGGLIDFGRGGIVPYGELLDELIGLLLEDAEALGCVDAIANARDIVRRGTSAHRQVAVYNEAVAGGAEPQEALRQVVDWLIGETLFGLEPAP